MDLHVKCIPCDFTFSKYNGIVDFDSLMEAAVALVAHNGTVHGVFATVEVI